MVKITCLQSEIISGGCIYPIFVGFASAEDIKKIAKVPSFKHGTPNESISINVLVPPVKEWQRPLDEKRRDAITSRFNNPGEFMPNPVLLSQNVLDTVSDILIKPKVVSGAFISDEWEIELDEPTVNQEKPLWIIDGQHRINGLANSVQKENKIPVVLLLNKGQNIYTGNKLAKIFAQVTTSAEKLDDIHNEWLTYSFDLGRYAMAKNVMLKPAMEVTAKLCSKTHEPSGINNPFYNQIVFNIKKPANPPPGGFHYDCIKLTNLFFINYFNKAPLSGMHLTTDQFMTQIVFAHNALQKIVKNHINSVFFGDDKHFQEIMSNAFLGGISTFLLHHKPLKNINEYVALFQTLKFDTADWDFHQWIRSLSSSSNHKTSAEIANVFFTYIFKYKALPLGVVRIADFFRGGAAQITLGYYAKKPNGKPNYATEQKSSYNRGSITTEPISPRVLIKLLSKTLNIGKIQITDTQSSPANPINYNFNKIFDLGKPAIPTHNPLILKVILKHYGDIQSDFDLEIRW